MTALAIFVEGQTELVFVEHLLFAILGYQNLTIERQLAHGNLYHRLGVRGAPPENAHHTILLVDCQSDGKVLPAIEERAVLLLNAGYELVLGLRDIHPRPSDELQEIYDLASQRLQLLPLPCKLIISVREIEAWFLSDIRHFEKYNPALTSTFIQESLGIDVSHQNVEQIHHPSGLLHRIYALVDGEYKKKLKHAHKVCEVLDYEFLYLEAPNSVPSLKTFVEELDAAIS